VTVDEKARDILMEMGPAISRIDERTKSICKNFATKDDLSQAISLHVTSHHRKSSSDRIKKPSVAPSARKSIIPSSTLIRWGLFIGTMLAALLGGTQIPLP
jgi:hypothetical protein